MRVAECDSALKMATRFDDDLLGNRVAPIHLYNVGYLTNYTRLVLQINFLANFLVSHKMLLHIITKTY